MLSREYLTLSMSYARPFSVLAVWTPCASASERWLQSSSTASLTLLSADLMLGVRITKTFKSLHPPTQLDNLNLGVLGSGTVSVAPLSLVLRDALMLIEFSGAAAEGSKEGIPSIAFSGATASHLSYTSLESDPTSQDSIAARIYSSLIVTFVNKLLDGPGDVLPSHTFLNVNFAPTDNCPTTESFKFIFTRLIPNPFVKDVNTCGKDHLPDETTTVARGCFASITALDDRLKLDVGKEKQAQVLDRLNGLVSCL